MATKKKTTQRRSPQQKYFRNLRNVHVALRLKESDRRIELAPRGQRGDVSPIKKGDQTDDIFVQNKGLLFEVITKAEADKIIEKQAINMQTERRHPAFETIRNEHGDEYEDDQIKVEVEANEQGKVVAHLEEVAEGVGNIVIDRSVGIRRAEVPGSTDYELPEIPDHVAPEDQAEYRRQQAEENAHDLGLKVTRGETQKGVKE